MTKNVITSYKLLLKQKKQVFIIMLADLLFFLSFALVFALLQERLAEVFLSISQLFSTAGAPSGVGEEAAKEFLSSFPLVAFYDQFVAFVQLVIILVGSALGLCILFGGIAWKKAYEIAGKKVGWKNIYTRFSLLSLFWTLVFSTALVVAVKVSSLQLLNVLPLLESLVKGFFALVFALLSYLAFVSHGFLDISFVSLLKKTFTRSFSRFFALFPLFVVVCVMLYATAWLVKNSLSVAVWLPAVLFVALFLPVLAWSRVAVALLAKK